MCIAADAVSTACTRVPLVYTPAPNPRVRARLPCVYVCARAEGLLIEEATRALLALSPPPGTDRGGGDDRAGGLRRTGGYAGTAWRKGGGSAHESFGGGFRKRLRAKRWRSRNTVVDTEPGLGRAKPSADVFRSTNVNKNVPTRFASSCDSYGGNFHGVFRGRYENR